MPIYVIMYTCNTLPLLHKPLWPVVWVVYGSFDLIRILLIRKWLFFRSNTYFLSNKLKQITFSANQTSVIKLSCKYCHC
jgi:hypothetical protein